MHQIVKKKIRKPTTHPVKCSQTQIFSLFPHSFTIYIHVSMYYSTLYAIQTTTKSLILSIKIATDCCSCSKNIKSFCSRIISQ